MTSREVKITCRHCGSDQVTHSARYIVRNLVLKSSWNEDGLYHEDFGEDELISDSCDSLDYPYDCKGCGKFEMLETDLLIDGKNHPDYTPEDPE